ncbi:19705_t:CDS:2, partial [Funneliformis geosporum]
QENSDKGLYVITNSYHELEYLNISNHTEFSEISICNIICSNPRYDKISKEAIDKLISLNPNICIKYLAKTLIHPKFINTFRDYLAKNHLSQLYQQYNPNISIISQSLNQNNFFTLMLKVLKNILADLTNPEQ